MYMYVTNNKGKIQGKLPELKAIVQYSGSLVKDHLHVFDVSGKFHSIAKKVSYFNFISCHMAVGAVFGARGWRENQTDWRPNDGAHP